MKFWLLVHGISIDSQDIVNLAKGLGMNKVQPNIYLQIQTSCCQSSGITCDLSVNQRVIGIDWSNLRLDGSINGTSIPSALVTLDLSNNTIMGTIPNNLPNALQYLDTNSNKITGNFPTVLFNLVYFDCSKNLMIGGLPNIIPGTLKTLRAFGNLFDGPLPSFPPSITDLYLGYPNYPGNLFSGSVTLYAPSSLYLNYNLITDVMVLNTTRLSFCDLSNNPLIKSKFLTNLKNCVQNNLFDNTIATSSEGFQGITGAPNTLSTNSNILNTNPLNNTTISYFRSIAYILSPSITSNLNNLLLSTSTIDTSSSSFALSTSNKTKTVALNSSISHSKVISTSLTTLFSVAISKTIRSTTSGAQTSTGGRTTITSSNLGTIYKYTTPTIVKYTVTSISHVKTTPDINAKSIKMDFSQSATILETVPHRIPTPTKSITIDSASTSEPECPDNTSVIGYNTNTEFNLTVIIAASSLYPFTLQIIQPRLIILSFLCLMKLFIGSVLIFAFYHTYRLTKVETVKSRKNVFIFRESARYTQELDSDQFGVPQKGHKGILGRFIPNNQHEILLADNSQEIELKAIPSNSEQSLNLSRELGPNHKSNSALFEHKGKAARKKEIEKAYRARGL